MLKNFLKLIRKSIVDNVVLGKEKQSQFKKEMAPKAKN